MNTNIINEYEIQLKKVSNIFENAYVSTSKDIIKILKKFYNCEDREKLYVISLNARRKVIGINLVSIGTVDNVLMHPREIFKMPILQGASSIVMIHNHPSGDVKPSKEDMEITNRIIECGKILEIPLMDHIIFYDNKHYSIYNNEEIDE